MRTKKDSFNAYNIVFYDGVCRLCNVLVVWLIKRDRLKKLHFMSLQSPKAISYLKSVNVNALNLDSIIYTKSGHVYKKSAAVLCVLAELGGLWRLSCVFWVIPCFIRNLVYDLIAKFRYRIFGSYQSCLIPTKEIQDRFLDL